MKNLLLIMAGIACLSLTACDDDDDDMNNIGPTASRMELLTNNDWILVSNIETLNGRSIDNTLEIAPTSRDDVFRFSENGEAVRDEGPTKEEGKPQVVESAEWAFLNNEQNLEAVFESLPISDEIVELSESRLVLRSRIGESEKIITFQAQ